METVFVYKSNRFCKSHPAKLLPFVLSRQKAYTQHQRRSTNHSVCVCVWSISMHAQVHSSNTWKCAHARSWASGCCWNGRFLFVCIGRLVMRQSLYNCSGLHLSEDNTLSEDRTTTRSPSNLIPGYSRSLVKTELKEKKINKELSWMLPFHLSFAGTTVSSWFHSFGRGQDRCWLWSHFGPQILHIFTDHEILVRCAAWHFIWVTPGVFPGCTRWVTGHAGGDRAFSHK